MAPGVMDPLVMLQTTKLALPDVAKVAICKPPVPYPVTPIGVDAKLHLTTEEVVRPVSETA